VELEKHPHERGEDHPKKPDIKTCARNTPTSVGKTICWFDAKTYM